MKRIISLVLCFIMAFTLCPPVFAAGNTMAWTGDGNWTPAQVPDLGDTAVIPASTVAAVVYSTAVSSMAGSGESVCEIDSTGYPTLAQALTTVGDGQTIKLLNDIDYDDGIAIVNKSVTFNLNGHTLDVVNDAEEDTIEEMSGLYVKGDATVALEGEGEFNVTGSWYGVFAECEDGKSPEVTVTNATGIGRDGVAAQSSKVTVKGNVTSNGTGFSAVWASYENAEVIVEGNVYANGELSMGVNAGEDGDVTVNGNVTVSGIDAIGVSLLSLAGQPSIVTIKGVIEAEKYILFEIEDGSEWEYSLQDGNFDEETADCIYYTYDNESFVYVSMFAGGSGTAGDPYLIAHGSQLYNIGRIYMEGKHFKQIADIDLGGWYSLGEGWDPIGNSEVPFIGTYDGDGYTISNLFIYREYQNNIGLFANIGLGAEIRNVGLINADVTGRHYVGGLAAASDGLIANSYVTGEVIGTTNAGGLISSNFGSVTDSYFDGTVSHFKGFDTDTVGYAGGLVGFNHEEGSITGCYAEATVESEGPSIGGLVGGNLGSITDSHAISDVTGDYYVGGLTGYNGNIVNNSYADGEVTGTSQVGGLAGYSENTITDSYFTGTVTGSDDYTGGLVGENIGGSIINSRVDDSTVTSAGDYVGGLAGSSIGLITSSCSTGSVTGGNHVGGLVGASFSNAGSGGISGGTTASYSDCAVEGEMYVGGLAGSNETPISESFATGNVTGTEEGGVNYTYAGGLVGHNTGPISDSYALGDVSGQDMVGGLVGYNEVNVTNCYEIGAVNGENYTGGLIGSNKPGAEIIGSFWNNNTSGQDSSDGGISKGSVTMKQQANYDSSVEADWDFDTIWDIDLAQPYAFNDGYPFLRWQDDLPPVLSETGASFVTDTTATLSFTSDKAGIYYYLVYDAAEDAPDAAAIKAQGEAVAKGSGTAAAAANNAAVTGLSASTEYKAYIIVEYAEGNTSDVAVISFSTEAALTTPAVPQNFTATPGDTQVALSWTAPVSDGGAAISRYEVSGDNGANWTDVGLNTSHTFTRLINGTEYTFKVRAVNSIGSGAEANATATPSAPADTTHTVNFYSNGSLYAGKTVTSGSALGANWPNNPTRSGYSFGGWFTGQNGAGTQYTSSTIVNADVDLYAKWTYNDGDSDDGRRRTPTNPGTPTTPAYKADVLAGNTTKATIPVTVREDVGTASVNTGSQGFDQGGTVITVPSIPDINTYSVGIPIPDLSTSDVQGTLTLNTDTGSITVPSNMLTGVAGANGNKAQITIGQGDKSNLPEDVRKTIGDRPLVQLTLSIDGKQTDWANPNAPVTVSIPYTPTAAELQNPESIVIWYIDGSGNIVSVPNGRYDPITETVTFTTSHFSYYAVSYNQVNFKDVANDAWYAKAVSFIAAREITTGTGSGNFRPEAKLTRGEFLVMLMKAYTIAPDIDTKDNFADAGNTYYTGYLAAAKGLGISSGVGSNRYMPDKEITRQEMFTLLYNALKVIGQLPQDDSDNTLSSFSDAGQIDSWAKEAMTLLVKTGTIGGNAGRLNPISTTTRGEMAQVLYNLLGK